MPLGVKLIDKFKVFLEKPRNQGRIFIFLGIIALGFGAWRIVDTIRSPFVPSTQTTPAQEQVQESVENQIQALNEKRTQDTDNDGLSDYDEEYVYGTSPYIEDTDSDGYSDKTEITSGNNPNCPAGEKCLINDSTVVNSSQTASGDLTVPINPYNMTDLEIRTLLLESGIDQATLDQVDATTLRQMFQQAYSETEQQTGTTVSNDTTNVNNNTDIQYTPTELRQLLIQGGVPQDQVNAVSDEELLELYQEVISSNNL